MATGTGLDRQIGYVAESAFGTGAVVTRFLPLVDATLKKDIEQVESNSIIAGRQVLTSEQWNQGNATIGGDIQHELYEQSTALLLRACFGTVSTTGTIAPYTHTFVPAVPSVSLTVQLGKPVTYGTVIPFTYTGCVPTKWELAYEAGKNVTFGMTVVAQEETLGTALATASYSTGVGRPWHAKRASITIDGTAVPVMGFKIGAGNSVDEGRRYIGSTIIAQPLRNGLAEYTGELQVEWGNPSTMGTLNYMRFLGGTESTLVATMQSSGTLSGTITMNVRYNGATPEIKGGAIGAQTIPFKCVASGSLDSQAITIVLKNNDSVA